LGAACDMDEDAPRGDGVDGPPMVTGEAARADTEARPEAPVEVDDAIVGDEDIYEGAMHTWRC
jgi:hypothetical protein